MNPSTYLCVQYLFCLGPLSLFSWATAAPWFIPPTLFSSNPGSIVQSYWYSDFHNLIISTKIALGMITTGILLSKSMGYFARYLNFFKLWSHNSLLVFILPLTVFFLKLFFVICQILYLCVHPEFFLQLTHSYSISYCISWWLPNLTFHQILSLELQATISNSLLSISICISHKPHKFNMSWMSKIKQILLSFPKRPIL